MTVFLVFPMNCPLPCRLEEGSQSDKEVDGENHAESWKETLRSSCEQRSKPSDVG